MAPDDRGGLRAPTPAPPLTRCETRRTRRFAVGFFEMAAAAGGGQPILVPDTAFSTNGRQVRGCEAVKKHSQGGNGQGLHA